MSTLCQVLVPDIRPFEFLDEFAQHFLRARWDRSDRRANVVQAVDAVEQVVLKRDLLDILEVVLEWCLAKESINVLKRRRGILCQPVEMNEVHAVAESARECV